MGSISHLERSLSYAVVSRLRRNAERQQFYAAASWAVRVALIALVLAFTPTSGRAGTFVAYGPQQYVRGSGTPTPVTTSFTVLDPTTSFTMRIDSSGVTSAVVTLNGVEILHESDFNATVTLLTKAVTLQATNQLIVELRGQPGESFRLQIIGDDSAPPTITAAVTPAPMIPMSMPIPSQVSRSSRVAAETSRIDNAHHRAAVMISSNEPHASVWTANHKTIGALTRRNPRIATNAVPSTALVNAQIAMRMR